MTSTDSSFCFSLQNESVVSRVVKEGALGAGMQLGHEATKLGLRYLIDKKMREKYDLSHADVWNYRPHVLESRDKVKKAFPGRANALDKAGNVRKLHFAQIIAPNLILTFYPLIIDAVEHTIGEPGHSYESLATIANVMGGFSAFITSAYRDHLELTQHQWHARVFDMGRLLLQAVIPNILDLCQQGFVDECGTGLSSAVSNIMVLATTMYFVRMIAGCFQCLFCSDNFTEYDDVESSVPSQDEAVDQLLNSSNENQSGRGQDSGPIIEEVFGDDEGSNSPSQDEADHELLSNMGSARSRLSSNAMSHFGSRNRSQANGAVDSEANNSSASQLNLPG